MALLGDFNLARLVKAERYAEMHRDLLPRINHSFSNATGTWRGVS
jgi:hypothetical protein